MQINLNNITLQELIKVQGKQIACKPLNFNLMNLYTW
jgi:hypothetical protein